MTDEVNNVKVKQAAIAGSRHISRSNIFKGTLILTLAGFITRVIGFLYKIFLSKVMGAEWLGIYQLIFPVYGIAFTIYATGIQTAISRLVAAEMGKKNHKNIGRILGLGLLLSFSMALVLSLLLYRFSDLIALRFLLEPRSASSLRILAVVFPFCGITSSINGYYYGLKRAGVPASTQLLEQMIRVIVVYITAVTLGKGNFQVTCEMAVLGLVIGEIASSLYNFISLFITKSPKAMIYPGPAPNAGTLKRKDILRNILSLSIPLSTNRLLINILHSIEAVLIPTMLRRSGLSIGEALSTYGTLVGMSIPFIMFPTAVINSLAVLLLPTVSEAQAMDNNDMIGRTASVSIKYSLIVGIMSTGIFLLFGKNLGISIFNSEEAGSYLIILAWICPLIYMATTLGSIINGLGKAHITFINSIAGTFVKIILIILLIPQKGIGGYLTALLVGQLIITFMDTFYIIRNIYFHFDAVNSLLKPGIIVAMSGFIIKKIYEYLHKITQIHQAVFLLSFCLLLCVVCIILFVITDTISKSDFK
ncbi:MAG: polysaccharide biosynthesis protein [Anaerolineaceae bacterium]|nr:MAG: polysaccharide biosynthesis protein [Anaerolineaceae bacterium]